MASFCLMCNAVLQIWKVSILKYLHVRANKENFKTDFYKQKNNNAFGLFRYTQRDAKKLFISNYVILLRTALKLDNEDRIINDKIEANFVFVFVYGIFSIIAVIIYVRPDKPHVIQIAI